MYLYTTHSDLENYYILTIWNISFTLSCSMTKTRWIIKRWNKSVGIAVGITIRQIKANSNRA